MLSEIKIQWMARKYSDLNLCVFVYVCVFVCLLVCVCVCVCVCMCVKGCNVLRLFLHGV